jgi:hypothetical protein
MLCWMLTVVLWSWSSWYTSEQPDNSDSFAEVDIWPVWIERKFAIQSFPCAHTRACLHVERPLFFELNLNGMYRQIFLKLHSTKFHRNLFNYFRVIAYVQTDWRTGWKILIGSQQGCCGSCWWGKTTSLNCDLLFIPQLIFEHGETLWNYIDRGNVKTRRITCPSVTVCTINPTWTTRSQTRTSAVRSRQLSHGTAVQRRWERVK